MSQLLIIKVQYNLDLVTFFQRSFYNLLHERVSQNQNCTVFSLKKFLILNIVWSNRKEVFYSKIY